jgi:hypothetical protein
MPVISNSSVTNSDRLLLTVCNGPAPRPFCQFKLGQLSDGRDFKELRRVRISRPLMKLPVRFCAETLQREIAQLPPDAWTEHPQKFDGNIAVALVSPGGAITNGAAGPMGPTQWLRQCTYILEIMQALACTWGRSRLMGLQAEAEVPEHVDVHYYWRTHLRLHIPIITNPDVAFTCAGETIHMAAGECWLLDSFHRHSVVNGGTETRIH